MTPQIIGEPSHSGGKRRFRSGAGRMRLTARSLASVLALLAALAPSLAVGQESTANDAAVEPAGFSSLQKSLIIPGWGQLAEKRYFEGIAFLSAEVLCLAGFLSYNHSASAYYDRYRSADNPEDALRFRALTEKYDTRRNRVLLAAAAVWVVNLIDIYAIVKKNEKKQRALRLALGCGPNSELAVTLSYRR